MLEESAQNSSIVRAARLLLQRLPVEHDGLGLWLAIRDAVAIAVGAEGYELYLYNHGQHCLQRIESTALFGPSPVQHFLGRSLAVVGDDIAVRAARSGITVLEESGDAYLKVAVPISGQPQSRRRTKPIAVIVLSFSTTEAKDHLGASFAAIEELIPELWPLCTYASIRHQFPLSDDREVHRLDLQEVLVRVLETLCFKLGFQFATISLVDEALQEIRTVATKTVCSINPQHWMTDAHHPLGPTSPGAPLDIQADVLQTGKVEIIDKEDSRLDANIWREHHHDQLIRVFVPLGRIGTIEAGFEKKVRRSIDPLLVDVLKRFAAHVTVALQNAQLYERRQQYASVLAQLHKASYELQTKSQKASERDLLVQVLEATLPILQADIMLVYPLEGGDPLDQRIQRFAAPIMVGELKGVTQLKRPARLTNIVHHIAGTTTPYYSVHAYDDPRLIHVDEIPVPHSPVNKICRSFTRRQRVRSFAGIPLMARGQVVGVLCVNYRKQRSFDFPERQVIELVAQQAAGIINSARLVRAQERRQLEVDLHDSVKASVRVLAMLCADARAKVDNLSDASALASQLSDLEHLSWGILSDIHMILGNLSAPADSGHGLAQLLQNELHRMRVQDSPVSAELSDSLPVVPPKLARNLLWLMREAVANALHHAHANSVHVIARYTEGELRLDVEDDGCGFDTCAASAPGHRGLASMRARAEDIGARLDVNSHLGAGTRVSVVLAYQADIDGQDDEDDEEGA